MTVVSPSRVSIGDLPPKSANTVRASITNESAGAPRAATAGKRNSGPRMIWDESLMNLGNATPSRLRADGTPPTARVGASGAGGGGWGRGPATEPNVVLVSIVIGSR